MATPVGGLWAYTYKALHDAAYDLPEDFFERVEAGIDPETRTRVLEGFHMGQRITRVRSVSRLALLIGALLVVAAFVAGLIMPALYVDGIVLAGAVLVAAFGLYAYAYVLFLIHRTEVHSFLAFVRAARDSSLGRDLA